MSERIVKSCDGCGRDINNLEGTYCVDGKIYRHASENIAKLISDHPKHFCSQACFIEFVEMITNADGKM